MQKYCKIFKFLFFYNFMIFFINFHDFNHFKLLLNVKFPTDFKNSVYFNVLIDIYILKF